MTHSHSDYASTKLNKMYLCRILLFKVIFIFFTLLRMKYNNRTKSLKNTKSGWWFKYQRVKDKEKVTFYLLCKKPCKDRGGFAIQLQSSGYLSTVSHNLIQTIILRYLIGMRIYQIGQGPSMDKSSQWQSTQYLQEKDKQWLIRLLDCWTVHRKMTLHLVK